MQWAFWSNFIIILQTNKQKDNPWRGKEDWYKHVVVSKHLHKDCFPKIKLIGAHPLSQKQNQNKSSTLATSAPSFFPFSYIVSLWLTINSTFLSADSDSSLRHEMFSLTVTAESAAHSGAAASVNFIKQNCVSLTKWLCRTGLLSGCGTDTSSWPWSVCLRGNTISMGIFAIRPNWLNDLKCTKV